MRLIFKKLIAATLLYAIIVAISASAISGSTMPPSAPSSSTTSSSTSSASASVPNAASASGLPDLTVSAVTVGTPSFSNPSEVNIPLEVTIKNLGDPTIVRFKLSVDVIDSSGRFVKPFTIPGQLDKWYPFKTGLGSVESHSFRGSLYVGIPNGSDLRGQTITIIPRVDSCSDDEFMPDYCRVQESNEENNEFSTSKWLPRIAEFR